MSAGLPRWPQRFTIRVTVVGLFLVVTSLTAAVAIGLQYFFSAGLAEKSALAIYQQTAASTREYLAAADARAMAETRLLAGRDDLLEDGRPGERTRAHLAEILARNPMLYAAYVGLDGGDFFEVVNLDSGARVRDRLRALPQDRWVVITVSGKGEARRRVYRYFDADFALRARRSEPSDYRADHRPWFTAAERGRIHKTAPYLFQHLQAPGQTYATRLGDTGAVLAVDVALESLSRRLARQKSTPESRLFLFQASGEVIATSEDPPPPPVIPEARPLALTDKQRRVVREHPVLTVSNELDWPPFDFAVAGEPRGYAIDVLGLVSQMTGLEFRYVNGHDWPSLRAQYREGRLDILQPILGTASNAERGSLTHVFVNAPFGVLTRADAEPVTRVEQLRGRRVAIPAGWSSIEPLRREFPAIEIVEMANVRAMFEAVREGRVDAGLDTAAPLRYNARRFFLDDVAIHAPLELGEAGIPVGLRFLVHPSRREVSGVIDLALAHVTPAQQAALRAKWLMAAASARPSHATVPDPALRELVARPGAMDRLHEVELDGELHYVYLRGVGESGGEADYLAVVTPRSAVLAPALAEVEKSVAITAALLLLLLPLVAWLARYIVRPVRRLVRENDKIRERRYGEVEAVESRIVEIDELGTSMMRMAREIEGHVREQEALMDAFTRVIAQAIDDKSAYTGAHCRRVPELAMLIAEKAQASDQPPFDRFAFADEHEWREFRVAAWLHDCGKITTPEHVVDKGAKLETIHNRIHEIRTRFEVLWRDAEIACLERCLEAPAEAGAARRERDARQRRLAEDFAFVAACNDGSITVDRGAEARLERIAATTWQRHFDDRLGLSPPELARRGSEADPLPATEPLLADRPWHRVERESGTGFDPRLGIRMAIPEWLDNHGELHNLRVPRGTLNPEERFRVQEHIIGTIRMLDRLPLPDELARVPRYASTHHETLDGTGYPRRLTGADLSIPERIMAVADIFEALTAADRPYKTARTVSEAIAILHGMVEDGRLDRDVFALFLESGAYLEYARRHLAEDQVDAVDVARYLR